MHDSSAPGHDTRPTLAQASTAGLQFKVADHLDPIVTAWRMVYMAYRHAELIEPNAYRFHTAPQAASPQAAVIVGSIGPVVVTTLTAIADSPAGLPLDRIYAGELATLRAQGRTPIEIGLFADRRRQLARTADTLFQLVRYAFCYALQQEATDLVMGVHPDHAAFYQRCFDLECFGAARGYPAVNNRRVVLLRCDLKSNLKNPADLHPALAYYMNNPVPPDAFDGRFAFGREQLAGSQLSAYLAAQPPEDSTLSRSA